MLTPRPLSRIFWRAAVTLAALTTAACSAGPPPPPRVTTVASPPPRATTVAATSPSAPAHCVIDGTVKDPTGAPIAGVLLAAVATYSPRESAITRSDAKGAFCFEGIEPGEYGLTATSPELTSTYVDIFEASGDKGHGLDVRLGGEGFSLRGRVTGPGGAKSGKQTLRISRISTFFADVFVVESDADGAYAVKLPSSEYQVKVEVDDATGLKEGLVLDHDLDADIAMAPRNAGTRPPPAEVVRWIKQKAIPLVTAEAGHGFDDMEPLRSVVGGARLVALGEATHGTREFFQMKHRMLEFLVEKMGFRAFAIEASFPETLAIDAYVRTGKGDPYLAVAAQGFWTWDTEEVVEMARWMRRYNEDAAHKEKLRFLGVDMQSPAGSAQGVAEALAVIDKALWAEVATALEPIDDDRSSSTFDSLPKAEQDSVATAARKVAARFDEQRAADVKRLGAEGWALARIHAHVLTDFVEMTQKAGSDFGVRDRAMADNTIRLLEMLGPASKMVLWAHNGHVQRVERPNQASMGHWLAEKLGKDGMSFGFAFDRGSFQAMDMGGTGSGLSTFTVPPAPPGSVDGAFALAGLPLFAIDLRTASGVAATWAGMPTAQRTIGAVYNASNPEAFFDTAPPSSLFDAFFFVGATTAARATPTGKRPDQAKKAPLAALANAGFEEGSSGKAPPAWSLSAYPRNFRYRATLVRAEPGRGKLALRLDREPSTLGNGQATLVQVVDARPLRGQRMRLSAQVKLDAARIGDEAFVIANLDGAKPRSLSTPIGVAKALGEVAVEIDVGADAERLTVGIVVTGGAALLVDDVALGPAPPAQAAPAR
ncbi:MAG: erythromycin esterase family protein [Minicystis sp.]